MAVIVMLSLAFAFPPYFSHAAVTPYFIAVNDTLLPFTLDNMPFITGGEIFVPDRVFGGVDVWATNSVDREFVRLYSGINDYVDFHTGRGGVTEDQDGNILRWPQARRRGNRFYVPLRQVSEFFGFSFDVIEIPRRIIADEQLSVIRIYSRPIVNEPTFFGLNERAIRTAYAEYIAQSPQVTPPIGGGDIVPEPNEDPTPDYSDVTIHLSFYDISAGSAEGILNLLDIQEDSGFHAGFFVSKEDIIEDPGLIRRIAGSGHTLGIWLEYGTFEEYIAASDLLFEAAKIRTVLVAGYDEEDTALTMAQVRGLVYWGNSQNRFDYEELTVSSVTEMLPQESGARMNLMFSCSEIAASILPGVYSYLRANEISVERITETVEAIH